MFITGLEYKFIIKTVDPDGTTPVSGKKNKPRDVDMSVTSGLDEEQKEEEEVKDEIYEEEGLLSSPASVTPGDTGLYLNSTGNKNTDKTIHHSYKSICACSSGSAHRCLRYYYDHC